MSGLNFNDLSSISRFLDNNNSNTVDKTEAEISSSKPLGNGNAVAGTRELSDSLSNGDSFVTKVNSQSSEKIADYFSTGRNIKLKPDAWISKEDFQMSDRVRSVIDSNGDNRVSSKEFSQALSSGKIALSRDGIIETPVRSNNNSLGSDPFAPKPSTNGSVSSDPFAPKPSTNGSVSSDPFAPKPKTNGSVSSDPFAPKPSTNGSVSSDPFAPKPKTNGSVSSDPFAPKPSTNGSVSSDPFAPKPKTNGSVSSDPFRR